MSEELQQALSLCNIFGDISDVYTVIGADEEQLCLKLHR
jgi:hypothetical protein